MKKAWEKPRLIVLVRGKPEEAVLLFCKTFFGGVQGPEWLGMDCTLDTDPLGLCSDYTTS